MVDYFDTAGGGKLLIHVQSLQRYRPRSDCGGADCDVLDGSGEMVTRATVQWVQPIPDGHAMVKAWLVGRPVEPPPQPQRPTIWQRLFG